MTILRSLAIVLLGATTVLALEACSSTQGSGNVKSTGTPVNPFADPGVANEPSAPLTGAQPQRP